MDTTVFLAQFWGWVMVITAVVYLMRGRSFLNEFFKMRKDKGFVFLLGWMLFFLGLVTVILHNVWVFDWRIIITLSGWAAIIQGIARVGFPKITQKVITAVLKNKITHFRIIMVAVGLLGAWLIYVSYIGLSII